MTRTPLVRALAGLVVAAGFLITVGGLLGFPVFPSNVDNSRSSEVDGCYYYGSTISVRVQKGMIEFSGYRSPFDLISDKAGLGILPRDLIIAQRSGAEWRLARASGPPEVISYIPDHPSGLSFLTPNGKTVVASKGHC